MKILSVSFAPRLFMCPEITKESEDLANNVEIEYKDIFGKRAKQINAKIVKTRERLLDKSD